MLHEITRLRQSNRLLQKRWFTSTEMDLFVWFRNSVPIRFQLAFDKSNHEQMIGWDIYQGFKHYVVDNGEDQPGKYKKTPILINPALTGTVMFHDMAIITRNFLAASENIEIGISDFIFAKLMECPGFHQKSSAAHTDRPVN